MRPRGKQWSGWGCTGTDGEALRWKGKAILVTKTKPKAETIAPVSNGAEEIIESQLPYIASVTIEGVAPLLFHAWNNEAVAAKSAAAKGSKAKKSDDLESYVYRCENGNIGIRGIGMQMGIIQMGRFHQDPRSPRKSQMDLLKAAVIPVTILADTGLKEWDYVDRQRVVVQRSAITRERPALRAGWRATFQLMVTTPEYVPPQHLNELIQQMGRLNGMGDYRPTYGRFNVVKFDVMAA